MLGSVLEILNECLLFFLCIRFLFVMNLSGKSHLSPLIFSHSSFPVTCVTEPHVPSCDYWFTNSLSYCPLTGGLCFTHLLSGAYHTAWPWQRSWEPLCRKHWVVFSGCHDKCYSIVFSRSSQPSCGTLSCTLRILKIWGDGKERKDMRRRGTQRNFIQGNECWEQLPVFWGPIK